ncbi:MAG TPA: SDR family NAD(P)-dependent oxidoreductase [Gemmatimonadales bacterium]|jgi:3-oxoacyl-[acyl-carrier protein] reductase|nr:SDR family NAD(P)-dependent oxidoreductase [Gemmatimonadales bacterium]
MISLAGQRVLITGGSRGIGRAAALLFARAGADVGITYHTRVAEAEAVSKEIRGLGRKAFFSGGDLADPRVVDKVFRECKAALGGLDCFVANAGIWPVEEVALGSLSDARWRSTMAQNLDAVFLTTRAALKLMDKGGRVVLVSSTAGQRGEAFHADYAATKGALISMTKSLAVEYAPDITVNCVAPGWVDTDMSADSFAGSGRDRIAATIPLKRIPPAEDIAGPILFLCSSLARHVTGEILNVNGGSVLCG